MDKIKKTVRTRDFIISTDGLLFASTNYIHPEDRIICFLRYIPDENGDREKDGIRYSKVGSEEAYAYLRENHPGIWRGLCISKGKPSGLPILLWRDKRWNDGSSYW